MGKVNGPGGRVEPGETPELAAVRETREEVGLQVAEVEYSGELQFTFADGYALRVIVYQTSAYEGTPVETDEAIPFWVSTSNIPYEKMWADDKLWLPHVLDHRPFRGRFLFDGDEMLENEVLLA
jgi:8-oxo-dGTP diphosphatase